MANESTKEMHYRLLVELGGGKYQGIQPGAPALGLEPLILFCGPSKSTLALRPADVSADNVRRAIAAKEAEYAEFANRVEQVWLPRVAA